ncbi:hypothetical protein [Paraburkholderia youngii]|uniref:hypothetical protein n=1 Tax=Paraburkholderia youngii TaxID=2782701 RepID=UPI0015909AE5|nr:hypothetical protein [Paraburkholderia youngii]NUX55948.1 hypothetical protein [Paraburkholderia youngii]
MSVKITMSFQYLAPRAEAPRAGYEVTDAAIELPPDAPIPRIGETIRHYPTPNEAKGEYDVEQYVVLSVDHCITRKTEDHKVLTGWHVTLTLGSTDQVADQRLLYIRE